MTPHYVSLILLISIRLSWIPFMVLGNGQCPIGSFFETIPDNTFTIYTDNRYNYSDSWVQPISGKLSVKIRACQNAHLLLSSEKAVSYEIVFGHSDNIRTVINKFTSYNSTDRKSSVGTRGLLQCNKSLPFWIEWYNKTIEVKPQLCRAVDPFLEFSPNTDIIVQRVNFSGYNLPEKKGDPRYLEEFMLQETELSKVWVKTPAKSFYKRLRYSLNAVESIQFNLTSAEDAKLAFSTEDDDEFAKIPNYELIISNKESNFSRNGEVMASSNSLIRILKESSPTAIWVSWKNGNFSFGIGPNISSNVILSVSGIDTAFRHMAVDSVRHAEWEFQQRRGSCVSDCRPGLYENSSSSTCEICSLSLKNCFECHTTKGADQLPVCTSCLKGNLLSHGPECVAQCPENFGYVADHVARKCVCQFLSCCGPVGHKACLVTIVLLGLLLLIGLLVLAAYRFRHLRLIDTNNVDFNQLSHIIEMMPTDLNENLYATRVEGNDVIYQNQLPEAPGLKTTTPTKKLCKE